MKPITAPLHYGNQGADVTNLQDALLLLLRKHVIHTDEQQFLEDKLTQEQQSQNYNDWTANVVGTFQEQFQLDRNSTVDVPTAAALNNALQDLGAFDTGRDGQKRVVAGQVVQNGPAPFKGTVFLLQEGGIRLGEDPAHPEGYYTIGYDTTLGLDGAHLRVVAFDTDGKQRAGATIETTKPVEIVNLTVPREDPTFRVECKVTSHSSAGVGGLRVQIVDKNVGPDRQLAEGSTADDGSYRAAFPYAGPKQKPDLQARVLSGENFLGASDVHYNASQLETLDVLLGDKAAPALQSEHEVLIRALASQFEGKLGDLKETGEQQDITYLANKTGWDARAVALAALADQFSQRTGQNNIAPAFFYALFRAGLPANEDTLYHADAGTLTAVWNNAAEQGVIPKNLASSIPQVAEQFRTVSAQKLLTGSAIIGASSLKEMLTTARINEAQQTKFSDLYVTYRDDMPTFWKAVGEDPTFGETLQERGKMVTRLQVDGKLGFLTINNAPLMQKVHTTGGVDGLSDPLQLAQMGYHRAEAWSQLLTEDVPVPKEIPGDTPETKRTNYASYLGAQIRLSYPTAAVAEMVKSGDLPIGVPDRVHAFLTEHQGKFEIGVQPIEQYIAKNNLQIDDELVETVRQVKRLQRVYQITPSDQAMIGLLKNNNLDSAYQIVRYDKDTFVQRFAGDLGGADHAALTYDKSVQVHNAVLNIALSHLIARTAPALGVYSPPSVLDPAPANAGDVIAYATLESLFGSMDFCACDHCRSILSPAAYLVDLLLFLHADEQQWDDFCANWRAQHGGAPYPFANQDAFNAANQPQNTEISPLNVLLSRRPDIEHLPLTCENTNTALPYIDVVNETLEYFIANTNQQLSLQGYLGHDTNGVASEDLLASAQFVIDSAYTTLQEERFPLPLPFHQPLENLRRYFNTFGVPLPMAMDRLRKSDVLDVDRTTNPPPPSTEYGWRDILMEELGLSRKEYEILTDSNAPPHCLWQMYGFPKDTNDDDVIAGIPNIPGLTNAKQFTRRVGITYDDLIALLKTRFINPNSDLIPKLERLGVSFATLDALHKDPQGITDAAFDALLPTGLTAPDPAEYGGDIKAWVKDNTNYNRIMELITLAISAGTWVHSKVYAIGDCVRPTAAQSESTLYYECTTAGTSAATEPKWPTTPGNTNSDGTVVWTCRDASSCLSFDNLVFRYTDPAKNTQNIGAVEFVRLLRFIRLWKKLGWTIEQTDAMICALYPPPTSPQTFADAINTVTKLDVGFLTLLPLLGIVVRVAKALNLTVQRDLLSLLACWSDVSTHGDTALYRQMFLNPALLKQDAVFADNGYGEFLVDTSQKLINHVEALRSAFNLSGDEYDQIIAALGYNADIALTIPNISAIFRRGWLARKLKLSVRELLLLTQLTNLDPFAAPDPTYPAIVRLIELVQSMKDQSFKSAAALYLIWNQDLSGKSAPDPAQIVEFGRTLRGDFAGIEDQFTVIEDPNGDVARAWITLVYGQEISNAFFAFLDDTLVFDVAYTHPTAMLDNTITTADLRISYDDFRHRLSHRGLVTTAMQSALSNVNGVSGDFKNAVDALFALSEDAKGSFFTRYPELKSVFDNVSALDQTSVVAVDYTHTSATLEPTITSADSRIQYDTIHHRLSYSGVLTAARRDTLKSVPGISLQFQSAVDALFALSQRSRGFVVLATLRPELSHERKRQQALQRLSVAAGVDLDFTQTTLEPLSKPYPLHADGDTNRSSLDDVLGLETAGLAAQFFFRDTATGKVDQSVAAAPNLDYTSGGSNSLPNPGNVVSGIWTGQVEAPEGGFYNFIIQTDSDAKVTLTLGGQSRLLIQNGSVWRNTDSIELKAGTLYDIALKVEKVKDSLSLKWETPNRAREVIPARYLYPSGIIAHFSNFYIRFLKTVSLAMGLGLTANELAYFATHADYAINADGWLNALPVSGNPALDTASKLLKPFEALLDFARIKTEISSSDESLLAALKDPATATQNFDSLLFTITRWNQTSLNDVLVKQFSSKIDDLGDFDLFRRVYDAFALVQQVGIPAAALIQATTNEPTAATVRDLQAALHACYDPTSWRDVVRPINDEMRSLQRDALVAYILHQMRSNPESAHIDTADKLFEYFLMDVQMDPCMQTSRIRHALSSVQLFIERCLMNLEPRVSPAAVNAQQWEWMKRYRVWEANRKVYLFPENWLEPELRDDKSPFFKEIESELLQSDITEERAATALLNYLSKLEEVAKLEPCGIYHIPDPTKPTGGIDHVIARTAGAHRKYYYRRYEYGYWTPWEQIKLDIEDNPVIPVVWKDRLLLFWLRILKETPLDPNSQKASSGPIKDGSNEEKTLAEAELSKIKITSKQDANENTKITVKAILCWSEYFNGKWQATKTSDINRPTTLDQCRPDNFNRSNLQLSVREEKESDGLRVSILNNGGLRSSFLLYNTHSLPVGQVAAEIPMATIIAMNLTDTRILNTSSGAFSISDYSQASQILLTMLGTSPSRTTILQTQIPGRTVQPEHSLQNVKDAPFFFEDSRHVFYVTATEQQVLVSDHGDYGIHPSPGLKPPWTVLIPPLVLQPEPFVRPRPKFWGDGAPVGLNPGVIDPSPMQRLVTEDPYIRQGIGTIGSVLYGDLQIGPSGMIPTTITEK